jgi:putative transposase
VWSHAPAIWACDFLPVSDRLFGPLHAFVVVAFDSRRVVHVGVTRYPTDVWVLQQLREATPFGQRPRYLIRDNDGKYGARFARGRGERHHDPAHAIPAPRANATCERLLRTYVRYFNRVRPHQGSGQAIPAGMAAEDQKRATAGRIVAFPVLGGLHHDYRRIA